MKKLFLLAAFVLFVWNCYAQRTVYKDTINIKGYVYDNQGKPVNRLLIRSKQRDLESDDYPITSTTDSTGYFEIKGAKPYDTLTTEDHLFYNKVSYQNRGSRFMIIYLPPAKHLLEMASAPPVTIISGKRLYNRKPTTFKIPVNKDFSCILFTHVLAYPSYTNDNRALASCLNEYIKYPQLAIKNNVEGIVRIGFTVEKDGTLTNFKIMNGLGYGCDKAVIDALKAAGKWQPAFEDGRRYAFNETVAVEFKLTDK